MATATIEIDLGVTGQTLTLTLFPAGSDTVTAVSGSALTEATNRKGTYALTTTAALSGLHKATVFNGATIFAIGVVWMSNDTTVHHVVDSADVLAVQDAAGYVAVPGSPMDLINSPNATAITAIQSGMATATAVAGVATSASAAAAQSTAAATSAASADTKASTIITAVAAVASAITALAAKFSGITSMAKWLGLIAGKTADAPTLAEVNATPAGAAYDNTTDSLEAIKDSASGGLSQQQVADALKLAPTAGASAAGSVYDELQTIADGAAGTGPWRLTITVNDGTNPLQAARVRVVSNIDQPSGPTDVGGQVILNVGSRTYSTAVRLAGYQFDPTSGVASGGAAVDGAGNVTMTGDGAVAFGMVAIVPAPPSGPDQTVATVLMLDEHGTPDPDGVLEFQIVSADGTPNRSYPRSRFSEHAGSGGYLSVEAPKNVFLRDRRNYGSVQGQWSEPFPTGNSDTFDVPETLGVSNATDR